MAQLPPDGTWLVQQIGGTVRVFHQYTDEVIVAFDPADADAAARAQAVIHGTDLLDAEQKAFAHFWSGYFYAHAARMPDWFEPSGANEAPGAPAQGGGGNG